MSAKPTGTLCRNARSEHVPIRARRPCLSYFDSNESDCGADDRLATERPTPVDDIDAWKKDDARCETTSARLRCGGRNLFRSANSLQSLGGCEQGRVSWSVAAPVLPRLATREADMLNSASARRDDSPCDPSELCRRPREPRSGQWTAHRDFVPIPRQERIQAVPAATARDPSTRVRSSVRSEDLGAPTAACAALGTRIGRHDGTFVFGSKLDHVDHVFDVVKRAAGFFEEFSRAEYRFEPGRSCRRSRKDQEEEELFEASRLIVDMRPGNSVRRPSLLGSHPLAIAVSCSSFSTSFVATHCCVFPALSFARLPRVAVTS